MRNTNIKTILTTVVVLLSILPLTAQVILDPDTGLDPGDGSGGCTSRDRVLLYRDADGDGLGDPNNSLLVCPGTPGFVRDRNDCDDSNANIRLPRLWYVDGDDDDFGRQNSLAISSCTDPSVPGGIQYSLTNDDCDDNNNAVRGPRFWYLDADGDGKGDYFNPSPTKTCSPPLGYVEDNTDCFDDPNNGGAAIQTYTWYRDFDQDGLGDPNISSVSCNPPHDGYWVLNNSDHCPNNAGELSNNGCPTGNVTEEPWNTIKVITYDVEGSEIAKTKSYFDCLGKSVQSLSLDFKTNTTWATQTMYDSQGRPALQSLSAPAYNNETFLYKENFILKPDNSPYTKDDFENDPENPFTVGDRGLSLGWYYSDRNDNEELQDITEHPFTRTIFSELNPGTPLKTIGGNKLDGQWRNGYSFTMKAGGELTSSVAFQDSSYSSYDSNFNEKYKILKTVSRDVHGNENVVFTDADQKVLAAARSGEDGSVRSATVVIGEQGYVDIHVPSGPGAGGFSVIKPTNIQIEVFDLITEQLVTGNTIGLGNGFYRVSIKNTADFNVGTVHVNYNENYYDYSLNYYDDLGRLTKSTQPLSRDLETTYQYDTLGQLISTTSPDEGTANFKYREDGQIRYSQNVKQRAANQFSYTNYDELGRPIESGVINSNSFFTADPNTALPLGTRQEVSTTQYDFVTASRLNADGVPLEYQQPTFLAGNVARTSNGEVTTYYSYDVYGRVKWMVQAIEGLGAKTLDYVYDDTTGSVTSVIYQRLNPEEYFQHRYLYDITDQSLVRVETSKDGDTFTEQAKYSYYETGALKRKIIAGGLQGIDYVYNLNGQLKAINHPTLDGGNDPGGDDNDFFGMTIDYNSNDYLRSSNFSPLANFGQNQYGGNIKGITWNTNRGTNSSFSSYTYQYDRNHWLEAADFNSQGIGATDYDVSNITYDANGNIKTLKRNKNTEGLFGNEMDNLVYKYDIPNGKPNQLNYVIDNHTTSVTNADDIESQPVDNYTYNNIGQLISNVQDNVAYEYNASGLVTVIRRLNTGTKAVEFSYDDKGKRYKKTTYDDSNNIIGKTFYVRDASGSAMAVYEGERVEEYPIYGSGRIGVHKRQLETTLYQITDHLGSVRAVIEKRDDGNAIGLIANTDYYPFGMPMPNRNTEGDYRYGYQGEFAEKEQTSDTGATDSFELRLWDARIGRWLTTDPYGQFASPYLGMGNNPINGTDPDGGKFFDHWEVDSDGNATLIDTEGDGIWIRNEGEKDYIKLSHYDFEWKMDAANQITDYYASSFSLFANNDISLTTVNFDTPWRAYKAGLDKDELAYVKTTYRPAEEIFGWQYKDPSLDISAVVPLFGGYFNSILNNKHNFINTVAHEYKHVLDAVDVRNLLGRGFSIHDAVRFSHPELEFRAIDYQRCHSSYECVDSRWIQNINSYQNLNRRRYNELLKN